jgi:transcriptional regulator with GAF, ATPase, and Fis domain
VREAGVPQPQPRFARCVPVWDAREDRGHAVCKLLSTIGAHPFLLARLADVPNLAFSSTSGVATVGLGEFQRSVNPGLEIVRELSKKGLKLVCYEDGTNLWPLGRRCSVLLAGAECLLDSTAEGFSSELGRRVAQLADAESGRQKEDSQIREVMLSLGLVGKSQAMISVFRRLLRVSLLSDLPIIITGETGTGKELVARAIHRLDPKRNQGPFVALNCGAVSPDLAESEFFGHRRGAFTGASQDRKGLIRTAEGGFLLLDEIGEMEGPLQTKLLRVLQESRVLGVGEDRDVPINVRVLAASNRDLNPLVQQGKFRADLYHRLNVLSIHVPSLRDRPEDIRPLIEYFLIQHKRLCGAESVSVSADFIDALMRVKLPGNIRELENLVRRALAQKENDGPLGLTDLPPEIWQQVSEEGEGVSSLPVAPLRADEPNERRDAGPGEDVPPHILGLLDLKAWNLSRSLDHCEKIFLSAALRRAQGNQAQAARLLGITPRTVYNKVRKHHLPL